MRTLSKKQKAIVGGVAVAVLGTSGVAYAYWSTGGSGTGTASTTTGTSDKLKVVGNVPNAMYPGDSAQTITATVTNTDTTTSYSVNSLKAYVTTDNAGCDGTDFNINGSTTSVDAASAVAITIAQKDLLASEANSQTASYTIKFNDKPTTDQNLCKNVGVTVHYIAG